MCTFFQWLRPCRWLNGRHPRRKRYSWSNFRCDFERSRGCYGRCKSFFLLRLLSMTFTYAQTPSFTKDELEDELNALLALDLEEAEAAAAAAPTYTAPAPSMPSLNLPSAPTTALKVDFNTLFLWLNATNLTFSEYLNSVEDACFHGVGGGHRASRAASCHVRLEGLALQGHGSWARFPAFGFFTSLHMIVCNVWKSFYRLLIVKRNEFGRTAARIATAHWIWLNWSKPNWIRNFLISFCKTFASTWILVLYLDTDSLPVQPSTRTKPVPIWTLVINLWGRDRIN